MFSQESSKLAVLESKIGIYEELSREMLSKLESAVDKISEGNTRIAAILAKHDERIEQSIKTDELLVKMIDEMKEDNEKEYAKIDTRFEKLEKKVEEISKIKWIVVGIGTLAAIVVATISQLAGGILTPSGETFHQQVQQTKLTNQ